MFVQASAVNGPCGKKLQEWTAYRLLRTNDNLTPCIQLPWLHVGFGTSLLMYPADITHSSSDAAACPAAYRMISSTAAAVGTHRCRTAMITSTQKHACKTDFVGYVDEMSLWGGGAEGWLEPRINCTEVQATFRDVAPDTVAAAEDVRTKRNAPTRRAYTKNSFSYHDGSQHRWGSQPGRGQQESPVWLDC